MLSFLISQAVYNTTLAAALTSAPTCGTVQTPSQGSPTQERTLFQTGSPYSDRINLRSDVAVVYGFGNDMPKRVKSWRDRGYKVHLMTGVAWGEYQDYYYGRFDGINHENEAQTRKNGEKVGHGGDVYYMSPGINYGKFLAAGVRRALEVGVEAVHLEEPEFWTFGGYGEGFKNAWQDFYKEPWQDPESSPDARWRAAKLMYYLYRRALQQVFTSIQEYNQSHGTHVRCYVPTHSLLNYSQWGIVSPESSLAKLTGCDGYIAQVWTGTARTPNIYQGVKKERTFETAFLEYGAMQNLVRSTGRSVWYLADPIEDDANHDWGDYRRNWESTLIASLLQPDVSQYEVMPWPERIFNGTYPSEEDRTKRVPIPAAYATELQFVINALKDMNQKPSGWIAATSGVGIGVGDSLMFQRGGPDASDADLSQIYGLALPFVKRGIPIQPVQLENVSLPGYLKGLRVLLLTYEGMKPLSPEVHTALAAWVKEGGTLVMVDADTDPFLSVREWWNTAPLHYQTPRQHLFKELGLPDSFSPGTTAVGRGRLLWLKRNPSDFAKDPYGSNKLFGEVAPITPQIPWQETSSLILHRGSYIVAAGLDETNPVKTNLKGHLIDLFDHSLRVQSNPMIEPGTRHLYLDLKSFKGDVVAASGSVTKIKVIPNAWQGSIEGIGDTAGVLVLRAKTPPTSVKFGGELLSTIRYDAANRLLYMNFPNPSRPKEIRIEF